MRLFSAGSLSYQKVPKTKKFTQIAFVVLVTGCLILSGCGAYPSNGRSLGMLGSSAAEEATRSAVDGQVLPTRGTSRPQKLLWARPDRLLCPHASRALTVLQ